MLIAEMVLIYNWRVVTFGERPRTQEVDAWIEPFRAYQAATLKDGRLPLWAPHIGLGFPILAESESGVLYPLNLLVFWALPPREGELVLGLLRTFLAGAAAYACARVFRIGAAGGLLCATVWMFNGIVVSDRPWLFTVFSWIEPPLMLAAAERLIVRRHTGTLLWAGVVFALAILAGHYQEMWVGTLVYVIYGGFRAFEHRREGPSLLGSVGRLALPMVIGAALAAPQLLTTWELRTQSPPPRNHQPHLREPVGQDRYRVSLPGGTDGE